MILFVFCFIAFVALSLYAPNDKKVFLFSALFLAIVFSLSYGNADYQNYLRAYNNSLVMDWHDSELLWKLLMHIGRVMRVSYPLFKSIIFFIGIVFIYHAIRKITLRVNEVLVLYFIYPFIIDATQIRNFIAMGIFVYALYFLTTKKKTDLIKYVLFILIDSQIHNIFIVYLLLVIVRFVDIKKAVAVSAVVFLGMIILFDKLPSLVMYFFGDYHNGTVHITKYIGGDTVSIRMIFALGVFYGLTDVCILWANKQVTAYEKNRIYTHEKAESIRSYTKCVIILSLTIVLNVFSMDFARVMRNIMIVFFAVMIEIISKQRQQKLLASLLFFMFVSYSFLLFIYYPYAETVFYPFIQNNYFFDFFNFT